MRIEDNKTPMVMMLVKLVNALDEDDRNDIDIKISSITHMKSKRLRVDYFRKDRYVWDKNYHDYLQKQINLANRLENEK